MNDQRFELRLEDGKVVQWSGRNGADAAYRYMDTFHIPVLAWRTPRAELVIGVDPARIVG